MTSSRGVERKSSPEKAGVVVDGAYSGWILAIIGSFAELEAKRAVIRLSRRAGDHC